MKTYSIISNSDENEIFLKQYCSKNGINLRKYSHGFVDYDWFVAKLSKTDADILKEKGLSLLKKTVFNRRKIDFFIDMKANK